MQRVDRYFWHGKTCDAQIEEFREYPDVYNWLVVLGDRAISRKKATGKELGEFFREGRRLFDEAGFSTKKFKDAIMKVLLLSTLFYAVGGGADGSDTLYGEDGEGEG